MSGKVEMNWNVRATEQCFAVGALVRHPLNLRLVVFVRIRATVGGRLGRRGGLSIVSQDSDRAADEKGGKEKS